MFLRSIRLENVRCIADAEISFDIGTKGNRRWTLITGDNGAGKSTILKAISLLMAGSEGLLDILQEPGSWVRSGAETCRISGVITTQQGEERELAVTLGFDKVPKGKDRKDKLKEWSFRKILSENEKSLSRLDSALEYTNRTYMPIGYGESRHSDARGSIGQDVFRHPRAQAVATLFADHAKMIPFESWAMDLENRKAAAGVKIIRDALEGLLPNVSFSRIDSKKRTILFNTPDGEVPYKHLSSGYRSVIGFVGDLMFRIADIYGDYKHPLEARALLLIDELGLHLHPVWQRILMRFLTEKFPKLQIVASTNSPVIAHQAGEGELFYLLRETPKDPPILHQFEGSPNKLLLHQLILSPVFGVETASSDGVECEREEYRKLKKKTRKTPADKRRMKKLSESLSEATDWNEVTPEDKEMKDLLNRIESELSSK